MCCKLTASHDYYLEIGARADDQILNRSGLLQISANIDLQDLLWILSIVGLTRFVLSPPHFNPYREGYRVKQNTCSRNEGKGEKKKGRK